MCITNWTYIAQHGEIMNSNIAQHGEICISSIVQHDVSLVNLVSPVCWPNAIIQHGEIIISCTT